MSQETKESYFSAIEYKDLQDELDGKFFYKTSSLENLRFKAVERHQI